MKPAALLVAGLATLALALCWIAFLRTAFDSAELEPAVLPASAGLPSAGAASIPGAVLEASRVTGGDRRRPASGPTGALLTGRVVVVEPGGQRVDAQGRIGLRFTGARKAETGYAAVVDGAFTFTEPWAAAPRLEFAAAWVDGVRLALAVPETALRQADGTVLVLLDGSTDGVLEVRSAATGDHLEGVEVLVPSARVPVTRNHPIQAGAEQRFLVRGAISPVQFSDPSRIFGGADDPVVFVRAAGHAWQRVELDPRGRTRVGLEPGGDLAVRIVSVPRAAFAAELFRDGSTRRWHREKSVPSPLWRLEGIPVGDYRLEVPFLGRFDEPPILSQTFSIRAGETTELSLDVLEADREARELVAVAMDLTVDGWPSRKQVQVELASLDGDGTARTRSKRRVELQSEGSRQVASVGLGPVRRGRYAVSIEGFSYVHEFAVVGPTELDVEVPPPLSVEVHCVDSMTGASLPHRNLKVWSSTIEADGFDRGPYQAYLGAGRHRVRAAPGRWTLELVDPDRGPMRAVVDCPSGTDAIRVEFDPPPVAVVRFSVEGRPVSGARQLSTRWVDVVPERGAGEVHSLSMSRGTIRARLTGPGRYRMSIQPPSAYRRVDDLVLELEAGEIAESVVDLRRR